MSDRARSQLALVLISIGLTLLTSTIILLVAGANPWKAFSNILSGAFENPKKLADIAVAGVPLLLCSAGMLVTFAAGLWNIGVEGQMIAGALMTTWLARSVSAPAVVVLPLSVLAGLMGGALWGLLTGLIRTYGRVNEIFAGLGLNFVAMALTSYLVFGPWKPPDRATMSGTDPFARQFWMPLIGNSRASLVTLIAAVVAIAVVYVLLRNTYWGLKLKAIGLNAQSAQRMGVRTKHVMLSAFVVCGALAGLAGSFQATAVYQRLIPQISGGYGYLSQLVVLLSGLRAEWVPLVVFFFSAMQVGSPRLELRMHLDSSLGGILQTSMVLFFVLARGVRQRLRERSLKD
jgi:simple sugar transport system permease protein